MPEQRQIEEASPRDPLRRAALHLDFLLRGRRASVPNEGAVAARRLFRNREPETRWPAMLPDQRPRAGWRRASEA